MDLILNLNVWVEVAFGGDESVDHNGSPRGSPTAYLNTVQHNDFEQPSCSGVVELGQKRNNMHCVVLSCAPF